MRTSVNGETPKGMMKSAVNVVVSRFPVRERKCLSRGCLTGGPREPAISDARTALDLNPSQIGRRRGGRVLRRPISAMLLGPPRAIGCLAVFLFLDPNP